MTVKEFIDKLNSLESPEADVHIIWDGGYRCDPLCVYLSKGGSVCVSDTGEYVYRDEDRPVDAPSYESEPHWRTRTGFEPTFHGLPVFGISDTLG